MGCVDESCRACWFVFPLISISLWPSVFLSIPLLVISILERFPDRCFSAVLFVSPGCIYYIPLVFFPLFVEIANRYIYINLEFAMLCD